MEENWLNDDYVRYYNNSYQTPQEEFAAYLKLLSISSEDTVLDLGCGNGDFLELAAPETKCAIGVDISPLQVSLANERLRQFPHATAICTDFVSCAAALRQQNGLPPITAIFSRKALHHLTDPEKHAMLQALAPLIAPEAKLYIEDGIFFKFERGHIQENMNELLEECAQYYGKAWEQKRGDLLNSFLNEHPTGIGFWTQELEAIGFKVTELRPRSSFYGGILAKKSK
ncbi:MAG: class I SAM-dependent methyltransferase [bacterium]|nr:class I SAM-dependent methyltransferase [bacterium]